MAGQEQKKEISAGLTLLNRKYFDFLYEMKGSLQIEDVPPLDYFITEIIENGNVTLVFNMVKGKQLRNDIKREINELYARVYEDNLR